MSRRAELLEAIAAQAAEVRRAQKAYYAAAPNAPQKLSLLEASKAAERQIDRLLEQLDRETTQPSLF